MILNIKKTNRALYAIFVASFWYLMGKRVRARNRFGTIWGTLGVEWVDSVNALQICEANDRQNAEAIASMKVTVEAMDAAPFISVLMPVYNTDPEFLQAAITSVREQIYPHWELCIADDASTAPHVRKILELNAAADCRIRVVYRDMNGHISEATNSALAEARGTFCALMDHDDRLTINALFEIAKTIISNPAVSLIYSDEDKIRRDGLLDGPHFKPDWNEELILTQNYINHLSVYRTSILKRIGGLRNGFEGSQDHDLVLQFVAEIDSSEIHHIPKILYHWRAYRGSGSFSDRALPIAEEARQRAVREYLKIKYPKLSASVIQGPYGCNRVIRELPSPIPKVSIIIPTKDQVDLLRNCITSIYERTAYPNFEVLVVDNSSNNSETLAYLDEICHKFGARVICYNAPFNYAAINNTAVRAAEGDIIAMLNNDVEVISWEWLREMVSLAVEPGYGAIGAKLLYGNGVVQHAGVVLGVGGIANHAHHGYDGKSRGYQTRLQLPQAVSAVTGACLVIDKKKYIAAGGMDEENLPIAFNDVDLCLSLQKLGFVNIYTPYAVLYHYESQTRGSDATSKKAARLELESQFMSSKWKEAIIRDPYYNPNFSQENARFQLAKKQES